MTSLLLEQPMRLGGLLVVMWIGALLAWRLTADDLWKRVATFGGIAAVCLVIVNVTVHTEREQLDAFLHQLLQRMVKQGLPGALDSISPAYNHDGVTFAFIKKQLQGRHSQWQFARIDRKKWSYKKDGANKLTIELTCRPYLQLGGLPRPMEPSTWSLRAQREPATRTWLITRITPIELTLPMDAGRAGSLKQLLRRR